MTNNILINKSKWRMILKDKLGYIYKRCSSRPLNLKLWTSETKEDFILSKAVENNSKIHSASKY